MSDAKEQTCQNCKFYDDDGDGAKIDDEPIGWCHRYPPNVGAMMEPIDGGREVLLASHPVVHDGNWCGEYREVAER